MNKNSVIAGGILLIGIVIVGLFKLIGGSAERQETVPTPTPTPVYQQVEGVEAEVLLRANKVFVDITISGLDGRFDTVEYDLTYNTDKGIKGVIGKVQTTGKDTFTREERLGTCSTGGKCTDHTGVSNFKLDMKFHTTSGETFILRKEFGDLDD